MRFIHLDLILNPPSKRGKNPNFIFKSRQKGKAKGQEGPCWKCHLLSTKILSSALTPNTEKQRCEGREQRQHRALGKGRAPHTLTPPTPVQQQVKQNGHFSAMRINENTKAPVWSALLKLQLSLYSCCQQFHQGLRSRTSSLTADLQPRALKHPLDSRNTTMN